MLHMRNYGWRKVSPPLHCGSKWFHACEGHTKPQSLGISNSIGFFVSFDVHTFPHLKMSFFKVLNRNVDFVRNMT